MTSDRAKGLLTGPCLVFVVVAAFHFGIAWKCGPAVNWNGETPEYYALLTDAFLAGQTNLLVQPRAELLALPNPYDPAANADFRLHDASLYHGKYYLYFGPTPALVLFLPYRLLTGSHLPAHIAVGLFAACGFACSCWLFFFLVKHEQWDCPSWFRSLAVLSLGTAPALSFLLTRPSFYEVAIGAGYTFAMAGFLFAAHALAQKPPRVALLLGAGICFGLAAGCRPNFALAAVLAAALVVFRIRTATAGILAISSPIAVCGLLLAAYNYVRFQNPFEFGSHYQLALGVENLGSLFSISKVVPSIFYLIFSPPGLRLKFPFIFPQANLTVFGSLPRGLSVSSTVGLLWAAPITALGLMVPFAWRDSRLRDVIKSGSTRFTIAALYTAALAIIAAFTLLGWIVGRYLVDFAPELVLLSWVCLAAMWQTIRGLSPAQRHGFQTVLAGVTLYSMCLDFWLCFQ